jgi:deoxycytidylate deaminase
LAHRSTAVKRHGAVIIKGGRVIGCGYNKYTNKPFFVSPEHQQHYCSTHAEVAAIRSSKANLRGATVYVARINKRGEERFSAPCSNCQAELDKNGIRKVVYTVWN